MPRDALVEIRFDDAVNDLVRHAQLLIARHLFHHAVLRSLEHDRVAQNIQHPRRLEQADDGLLHLLHVINLAGGDAILVCVDGAKRLVGFEQWIVRSSIHGQIIPLGEI